MANQVAVCITLCQLSSSPPWHCLTGSGSPDAVCLLVVLPWHGWPLWSTTMMLGTNQWLRLSRAPTSAASTHWVPKWEYPVLPVPSWWTALPGSCRSTAPQLDRLNSVGECSWTGCPYGGFVPGIASQQPPTAWQPLWVVMGHSFKREPTSRCRCPD